MPLLIDGHNLIGKLDDLSLRDKDDEHKLAERLRAYAARTGKRITVVFDPARDGSAMPSLWQQHDSRDNVTVIWADAGQRADDVIRERVGQFKDRQGWLVVTSDAAVAHYTRQCGVRVQASEAFAAALKSASAEAIFSQAEKPSATRQDATAWADVFKDPNPEPYKPKIDIAPNKKLDDLKDDKEAKRLRRNEQLAKQVANQRKLI